MATARKTKDSAKKTKEKAGPDQGSSSKGGRPSSYRAAFVSQAEKLCRLGATDLELADFFSVSVRTIHAWKLKYPEFYAALQMSKAEADKMVEQALFRRAIGYTHPSEKIFDHAGVPLRVETQQHYPPDVAACAFWLKNRQGWRDRPEEKNGDDDAPAPQSVKVIVEVKDARRNDRDTATT